MKRVAIAIVCCAGIAISFLAGWETQDYRLVKRFQNRHIAEAQARMQTHAMLEGMIDGFVARNGRLPYDISELRFQRTAEREDSTSTMKLFQYQQWTYTYQSESAALLISPVLAVPYQRGTDCLVTEFPMRRGYEIWRTEDVFSLLSRSKMNPKANAEDK